MTFILHSFFVHFTVALFIISYLLDLIGVARKQQLYHQAAWLNLVFAALAVLLSATTGLLSKAGVQSTAEIQAFLEQHQTAAFGIVAVVLGLFLWRAGRRGEFPERQRHWYLALGFVGLVLVILTAWLGGQVAHH